MVQFQQQPIIEEGIDNLVSESEKKEKIRKALEIHMLQNREVHSRGQTLFSFTQGNPEAVIGKIHSFSQAMGEEEQPKKQSIEEQRLQQQQQQWQTEHKAAPAPVRTCPCCVRFLQDTFHMGANEATAFAGGGGIEGGTAGYQSNAASESYGATGPSSEYSGAPSGSYSGSGGDGGSGYISGKKEEPAGKYMRQSKGYEEE